MRQSEHNREGGQRPGNKQDARSRRTTERMVAEARRLFAEYGFAGVSAEQIVAASGVTRGGAVSSF